MQRIVCPRVVITGCGAITPLGDTAIETWDAIKTYRLGYARDDNLAAEAGIHARFFGLIENDQALFKRFPKSLIRGLPFFARLSLLAAAEALDQAFPGEEDLDRAYDTFERSVVLGTGYGWVDSALPCATTYLNTGVSDSFLAISTMHNVATAAAAIQWECRGPQATPVAACASGSIAIGEAVEMIRSGRTRMAIAGAADSYSSALSLWAVDVIGALSKETNEPRRACCPFSRHRSGFVPSSGAGAVVLEELESAVARGARVLGEVTGYSVTTDAAEMTAPAADMRGRIAAVEGAIADAHLPLDAIQYVNAHGTSTPANDRNETEVLKRVFGDFAYELPISSTKSYIGHTIGAAGAIETILCLYALSEGLMPATANYDEPDPECDLDYIPNEHRVNSDLNRVLNLSFGFGGVNSALVLERCTAS